MEIEKNWSPFNLNDTDVGDDSLYNFDGANEEENYGGNGSSMDDEEDDISDTWENNFPTKDDAREDGEITPETHTQITKRLLTPALPPCKSLTPPSPCPVLNFTPCPIPAACTNDNLAAGVQISPPLTPGVLTDTMDANGQNTSTPTPQPTNVAPPVCPFSNNTPSTPAVQTCGVQQTKNPASPILQVPPSEIFGGHAPLQQPSPTIPTHFRSNKNRKGLAFRVSRGHSSGKNKTHCGKRRRILSPVDRPPPSRDTSLSPIAPLPRSPEQSIDLNRASSLGPETSATGTHSESPTRSESKLTTQIGAEVGFQIEEENMILKEIIIGEGTETVLQ